MESVRLSAGDHVYHPRFGFGVVHGLSQRQTTAVVLDGGIAGSEDYYEIHLHEGGSLLVPAARADELGLRLLTNGLKAVEICLRSPAEQLPERNHARVAELRARAQAAEPTALARAVRDLLAESRIRSLTAGEKMWLDKAYERLVTEVAVVDNLSPTEARAAIQRLVEGLAARS